MVQPRQLQAGSANAAVGSEFDRSLAFCYEAPPLERAILRHHPRTASLLLSLTRWVPRQCATIVYHGFAEAVQSITRGHCLSYG
jgi:hypothetical protein